MGLAVDHDPEGAELPGLVGEGLRSSAGTSSTNELASAVSATTRATRSGGTRGHARHSRRTVSGDPMITMIMSSQKPTMVLDRLARLRRVGCRLDGPLRTNESRSSPAAASGIGLAISERLAADGAAVAVFDRDGARPRRRPRRSPRPAGSAMRVCTVDVTDRAADRRGRGGGRASASASRRSWSTAPGSTASTRSSTITLETWQRILDVNLTGTFHCCQAVVPDMIDAGWGRIVNISSSSAQGGQPLMTHYVAAKAGVIGFTKALALELGPQGITVNTIPPGLHRHADAAQGREQGLPRQGRRQPRGARRRCAAPAGPRTSPPPARSSCRDEASYITGQVIGVNGGRNT